MSSGTSPSLRSGPVNRNSIHSLSRSSLHSLHVSTSSQDPSLSKTSEVELRALDVSLDPEQLVPYSNLPWHRRARTRIAARHPRLYAQASRFLLYWRGPRPKIDLPSAYSLGDLGAYTYTNQILDHGLT